MKSIHDQCEQAGKGSSKTVDYAKGANVVSFQKVANAMIAQGRDLTLEPTCCFWPL